MNPPRAGWLVGLIGKAADTWQMRHEYNRAITATYGTPIMDCRLYIGLLSVALALVLPAGAVVAQEAPATPSTAVAVPTPEQDGATQLQRADAARVAGDLSAAQRYLDELFAWLDQGNGDALLRADALNTAGAVAIQRGDPRAAAPQIAEALVIVAAQDADGWRMLKILNNLGGAERDSGDLAAAYDHLRRAAALATRLNAGAQMSAIVLHNLGQVQYARGDMEAALASWLDAQRQEAGLGAAGEAMLGSTLLAIGAVQERLAREDEARAAYRKALAIFERQSEDCHCVALPLTELGGFEMRSGRVKEALKLMRRAHRLQVADAPDGIWEALTLRSLAGVQLADGAYTAAERSLRRALRIERVAAPDSLGLAFSEYLIGQVHSARRHPEAARGAYCAAAATLDRVQVTSAADNYVQAQFRAQHNDVYLACMRAELEAGRPEAAYAAWERARARGYLETLRQRALELQPARRERLPSPLKTLDAAAARAELAEGTLAFSFAVGPQETTLFALDRSALRVVSVPLGRAALAASVQRLRASIEQRSHANLDTIRHESAALFSALFAEFRADIGRARRVLISPDGPLHELPFAALWDAEAGQWLIEIAPLTIVDSLSALSQNTARPRIAGARRLLAVADPERPKWGNAPRRIAMRLALEALPPLPGTRLEVESVAAAYAGDNRVLLGAAATEAEAKRDGHSASVLHFAVHAVLDRLHPLDSALILRGDSVEAASDGLLQAWEVFEDWEIAAQLVVLSACDTGRGTAFDGEGLLGLTRAFQFAGARNVVASLWSVADRSTAELMQHFYAALGRGEGVDRALRSAQLILLKGTVENADEVATRGVGGLLSKQGPAESGNTVAVWAAFQVEGEGR